MSGQDKKLTLLMVGTNRAKSGPSAMATEQMVSAASRRSSSTLPSRTRSRGCSTAAEDPASGMRGSSRRMLCSAALRISNGVPATPVH